jgi:hypothetical protein
LDQKTPLFQSQSRRVSDSLSLHFAFSSSTLSSGSELQNANGTKEEFDVVLRHRETVTHRHNYRQPQLREGIRLSVKTTDEEEEEEERGRGGGIKEELMNKMEGATAEMLASKRDLNASKRVGFSSSKDSRAKRQTEERMDA